MIDVPILTSLPDMEKTSVAEVMQELAAIEMEGWSFDFSKVPPGRIWIIATDDDGYANGVALTDLNADGSSTLVWFGERNDSGELYPVNDEYEVAIAWRPIPVNPSREILERFKELRNGNRT